ncbi:hypothetical protein NDU88_003985 [Pleurodeles waltl]|uniref:Uncharacterized protein n=1 Tax=Pleurodeles waltl TaxID=8319 RepID=A0AAV7TQ56_PLEWA|nr:hypothetical protein NDU88_003985 [Pleurodeles waltl]
MNNSACLLGTKACTARGVNLTPRQQINSVRVSKRNASDRCWEMQQEELDERVATATKMLKSNKTMPTKARRRNKKKISSRK